MLTVPRGIREVLVSFERRTDSFEEGRVVGGLRAVNLDELDEDGRRVWMAEYSAFSFFRASFGEASAWGTHFGPFTTLVASDGRSVQIPNLSGFDEATVGYLEVRAQEVENPVLKARYSDVVWDLKRRTVGQAPDVVYARLAVDAYLEAAELPWEGSDEDLSKAESIARLQRALEISLSIRDENRVGAVRDAMFRLFERIAVPTQIGTWWFFIKLVFENKKISLSPEKRSAALGFLETGLRTVSDISAPETFSPWAAERFAEVLAKHYRGLNQEDEVARVVRAAGMSFEKFAEKADPPLAMAWLQDQYEGYRRYGLNDDAKRAQLAGKAKGRGALGHLASVRLDLGTSREDMFAMAEALTGESLNEALDRFSRSFIPNSGVAMELVEWEKENTPLLARIGTVFLADGQIVGKSDSSEDNIEGRLYLALVQQLEIDGPLMGLTLERIVERYKPSAQDLVSALYRSPLPDPGRRPLLAEGLQAFLAADDVKCIHVLVPQLESLLRRVLDLVGEPTNRAGVVPGTMQEKTWSGALKNLAARKVLPADLCLYLQVFFADPRGRNIRNRVAHGLLEHGEFDRRVSDRVVHALFALAAAFRDGANKTPGSLTAADVRPIVMERTKTGANR